MNETIDLSTHSHGSGWIWKFYHLCSISSFKIWNIIIVNELNECDPEDTVAQ